MIDGNKSGLWRSDYDILDKKAAELLSAKLASIKFTGVFGDATAVAEAIAELKKIGVLKWKGEMNSLLIDGRFYRVDEWLTPNDYAQKYEKPLETVMSWIRRDVLPADRVVKVEQWKLTLLKDEPFESPGRGRRRSAEE